MNKLSNQTRQVNSAGILSCIVRSVQMLAALIVIVALPSLGQATVFNVREAGNVVRLIRVINRANANNQADTINLAAGTYTLTKANNRRIFDGAVVEANGLPIIRTKITINGAVFTGDGSARTTTQRQADAEEFRIFQVAGKGNLTLNRIRVRGGFTKGFGGGIENFGRLRLVNAIVSRNVTPGNFGGGIINGGAAILISSTVRDNSSLSSDSGGIDNNGTLRLFRSTISGNQAAEGGGGITNNPNGILSAVNSTISGNVTIFGGGELPVGGILNAGIAHLRFVTITENRGGPGLVNEDPFPEGGFAGGTVTLSNSILAGNERVQVEVFDEEGNSVTKTFTDCAGTLTSGGFNLVGDKSNCMFKRTTGDRVGTPSNPISPQLRPLANYGGPTQTHALMFNSPAIDHGNSTDCPDTDQRGFLRPADGDGDSRGICDIGAFERGAVRR